MSATSVKNKNTYKAEKKKHIFSYDTELNIPGLAACFFMVVSSSKAAAWDFRLPGLVLVLTAAADDIMEKAVFSAGGVLALAMLSLTDSRYIPYLLGQIMYIAGYTVLKKEKYILPVAVGFTVVAKILLVNGGPGGGGSLYTILEGGALWRLVQVVKNGREMYSRQGINHSFTDILQLLVAAMVAVLALSGFDSRLLYVGAAVALAFSWLWVNKNENIYSLIALLCFFAGLRDKQGFEALFIRGRGVWLPGAVLREKASYIIYPVTIFTAFAANLVFLEEINGFALTGTVIGSLVCYTTLPYLTELKKKKPTETFRREKDYRRLQTSMKKLEESLNFLGSCAIDISKLNEKNMVSKPLEDMVAEDVCRKCRKNSHCWQEKYSFTSSQFARYARSMSFADSPGFEMGFYSQCSQIDRVKASFRENSRLELSRRYIRQSAKNNQKLLQSAFLSVSAAVGEMLHKSSMDRLVNSSFTMQLDRFLGELGINHSYCLRSRNPDRVDFSAAEPIAEKDLYKIRAKLENMYDEKFGECTIEQNGHRLAYSFRAVPMLAAEWQAESKPLKDINGDGYMVLAPAGRLYVLLSDGMGTGAAAAAESRTVLAMAKSLLMRGVSVIRMMAIVNLAMNLRGSGENGASLEVLEVDMYTGKSKLVKAGAGVSLVFNEKGLTRYYKDSLPLGILKDVKYSVEEFTLSAGDTVLMISDGVGDVSSNIRNLYDKSPADAARFAISESKGFDDKLAVAVRIAAGSQQIADSR